MRLFIAIDLPWEIRERLARLATGLPGARWVSNENLHMTLRFIGEVQPNQAEDIDLALQALRGRSFPLTLKGIGTHTRGGRDVALWVGVERTPGLEHLQAKIETALQRAGLASERRRFNPHVTLARCEQVPPEKLAQWMQAHNLVHLPQVQISHFTLFSSRLGKEHSVYTAEAEYTLS